MIGYDLIGNTPLVLLETFSDEQVQIYAKLEQYNPGGSVKDRLGKFLVEQALEQGLIKKEILLLMHRQVIQVLVWRWQQIISSYIV